MKTTRKIHSLWLYSLILAAILAQGLLPRGFMPTLNTYNGSAQVAIVICTSSGPTKIFLDASQVPGSVSQTEPHSNEHDAAPTCPFAPALAAAMPMTNNGVIAHPDYKQDRAVAVLHDVSYSNIQKNWFSQGPPHA
jgi:hypothetical protein